MSALEPTVFVVDHYAPVRNAFYACYAQLVSLWQRSRPLTRSWRSTIRQQIAGTLGTVEQTVKVHRAHMMRKMKVDSVVELVRLMEPCRN